MNPIFVRNISYFIHFSCIVNRFRDIKDFWNRDFMFRATVSDFTSMAEVNFERRSNENGLTKSSQIWFVAIFLADLKTV